MKKSKFLFFIFMFFMIFFNGMWLIGAKNEPIYNEYQIGDKIWYQGIEFYVIENSNIFSDTVALLKATPLKVEEVNAYGEGHVNNYTQSSKTKAFDISGYGGMAYYSSPTCGYDENDNLVTDGCVTDYAQSDIKYVVDAWSLDKLTLSDLQEDKLGYKARLLTYNELIDNLGYNNANWNVSYWELDANETPSWVYSDKYYYMSMDPYDDSTDKMWGVSKRGNVGDGPIYVYDCVVRPVINLKKDVLKKEDIIVVKSIDSKTFKIGDTLEYNGIKFYAIENSDESKKTVALLKAEPLTTAEVNKYGKGYINKYKENREADDQNGYGFIAYYSSDTCKDYTNNNTGCTSDYSKSDIKQVVDAWALDTLSGLSLTEDDLGYKVRLITLNELVNNLNFTVNSSGIYAASNLTPSFVYSKLYRYLTMTPTDDSNANVYTVNDYLEAAIPSAYSPTAGGGYVTYTGAVRPVIILEKTGDIASDIVEVPDTFLSKSLIFIGIGSSIIIISITIALVILKKQKRVNN